MDERILIPITLFISIAYAIKAVVDARVRAKLIAANSSQDLIRSILLSEEEDRRRTSLRWGIVLLALAGGFAFLQDSGWTGVTPGAIAVILAATGLGNLAFYAVATRLKQRT